MPKICPACSALSLPRRASRVNRASLTDDDFGVHSASRRVNPPADTDPPVTPATRLPFLTFLNPLPKPGAEAKLARRGLILAAALAVVAASLVVHRRRLQRARKLSQSAATARWESEGGATVPAGETG